MKKFKFLEGTSVFSKLSIIHSIAKRFPEQIKKANEIQERLDKIRIIFNGNKSKEIFDKVKKEAYAQTGDNTEYVKKRLDYILSRVMYGQSIEEAISFKTKKDKPTCHNQKKNTTD